MRQIIFDCDNTFGLPGREIDDGLALLYLLGRPEIELLGITATFGNGSASQSVKQTRRLLEAVGRSDISIYQGAARAGQGDTPAADFIANTLIGQAGAITLLSTGPLTNLHAAEKRSPGSLARAEAIVCMGGVTRDLIIGRRRLAELNLSADPDASHAILHRGLPVTLFDAHVCLGAAFTRDDLALITHWPRGYQRTVRRWLTGFDLIFRTGCFYLWDLLPVIYLTHPALFSRHDVVLSPDRAALGKGRLIPADGEGASINMPETITDPTALKALLFKTWEAVIR